jgi:hypothetical protein
MSLVEKEASIAKSIGQCAVRGSSKVNSNVKTNVDSTVQANSNEFSVGTSKKRGKQQCRPETEVCSERISKDKMKYAMSEGSCDNGRADSTKYLNNVYSPDREHYELSAPPRKRRRGHPTTARDKAPYENKDKRSRFCTICRGKVTNAQRVHIVEMFLLNQGNQLNAAIVV